jgi:hypothetical protein
LAKAELNPSILTKNISSSTLRYKYHKKTPNPDFAFFNPETYRRKKNGNNERFYFHNFQVPNEFLGLYYSKHGYQPC